MTGLLWETSLLDPDEVCFNNLPSVTGLSRHLCSVTELREHKVAETKRWIMFSREFALGVCPFLSVKNYYQLQSLMENLCLRVFYGFF